MTREEWLAAVSELLARRYGISITDTNITEERWAAGVSPEETVEATANRFRLKRIDQGPKA
jgi:hypothetical protein